MTYEACYGGTEHAPLATIKGYRAFADWTDQLDEVDYYAIVHLVDHGWTMPLTELAEQLAQAMRINPPEGDLATTLGQFAAEVDRWKDRHLTVFVTDGWEPDDGQDGPWFVDGKQVA